MSKNIITCLLCVLISYTAYTQTPAEDLLNQSIAFHDPNGNWEKFNGLLTFITERPDRPDGKRKVLIDNKRNKFSFWAQYDEGLLNYSVEKDQGSMLWNGEENISEELAKKYRVAPDRAVMYRNYYTYLYGMPMKLKDPGTTIHPEIERVSFYGKTLDKIKVTYDPSVGEDIWYFYFNIETHALEAYQFFHDESKNDGEYILFEELKEVNNIKIPRIRKWFYNSDEKFLATDILKH